MKQSTLEHLREKTGDARRQLAARQAAVAAQADRPPQPGDVYLLPETTAYPFEWLVAAADPATGRLLLLAADTHPVAGSADLALPATTPGGPLTLRCRHALWCPADLLRPEHRTRTLPETTAARALRHHTQAAAGTLAAGVLEREVDDSPEYEDWVEGVVARAHALLAAKVGEPGEEEEEMDETTKERERPDGLSAPWVMRAVAGVFFASTVGMLVWNGVLERQVGELSEGEIVVAPAKAPVLTFGEQVRGSEILDVEAGKRHVEMWFQLTEALEGEDEYLVEIVDPDGERVWSHSTELSSIPLQIVLPRRRLPDGTYYVRLFGTTDAKTRELDEKRLEVRSKSPAGAELPLGPGLGEP